MASWRVVTFKADNPECAEIGIEEYFPPGKGDRSGIKYGFHGVLTPIDLHQLGDADSGE